MGNKTQTFIGVVIVNYNTSDELFTCMDSIMEKTRSDYRIYVVENGSAPEIRDAVIAHCAHLENVEVVVSKDNLGYSRGNNLGIARAIEDGARYIAIVNSDVVFVNDALSTMAVDIVDEVVVVGPRIATLDEENGQLLVKTYSYVRALGDRQPFYSARKMFEKITGRSFDPNKKLVFSGMVSGCCFLIDASAFEKLGLFDDNVFLYSEERILSIKLDELGYKACYEPEAAIIHMEGKSTSSVGSPFADFHRYASDYYAVRRYCDASKIQMALFKALRLGAFRAKAKMNEDYVPYCELLEAKMKAIDAGDCAIGPSIVDQG